MRVGDERNPVPYVNACCRLDVCGTSQLPLWHGFSYSALACPISEKPAPGSSACCIWNCANTAGHGAAGNGNSRRDAPEPVRSIRAGLSISGISRDRSCITVQPDLRSDQGGNGGGDSILRDAYLDSPVWKGFAGRHPQHASRSRSARSCFAHLLLALIGRKGRRNCDGNCGRRSPRLAGALETYSGRFSAASCAWFCSCGNQLSD